MSKKWYVVHTYSGHENKVKTNLEKAIHAATLEEHFGQIEFEDGPEGGSRVRLVFDAETLAQLDRSAPAISEETSAES